MLNLCCNEKSFVNILISLSDKYIQHKDCSFDIFQSHFSNDEN